MNMVNKLSKFQSVVYAFSFNVFCVTETLLSNYLTIVRIYLLFLFCIVMIDPPSPGGGVLILNNILL